jgi:hypothetical protein
MLTEATPLGVASRNRTVSESMGGPVTPEDLAKSTDPSTAKSLDDFRDIYDQPIYWRDWQETFDYALWIDVGARPQPRLTQLRPLASGDVFEIYQIIKP